MMIQRRSRTLAVACVLAATTLAAAGCAKSETSNNAGGDSSQAAQEAKTPKPRPVRAASWRPTARRSWT